MRFSLAVPTIKRTKELDKFLDSLIKQRFDDFEVIIIDQNTDKVIEYIIQKYDTLLDIKWLRIEARGASYARNVGIDEASGEIITFPDDDCEYPADLLAKINKIFKNNSSIDGITIGTVDKNDGDSIIRLGKKKVLVNRYNILQRCLESGIFVRNRSIGGSRFDIKLGVGTYTPWWSDEGPDFILQLLQKDCKIEYHPELLFYHPNPVSNYDLATIERSFKYGKGRGMFLKKNEYDQWFVLLNLFKYIAGIGIGIVNLNMGMIKYYYWGLKGRLIGYLSDYESY